MTDKTKSDQSDSVNKENLKSSISRQISREEIKNRYGDLIDSLPIIIYVVEPRPPYAPIYVSKGIEMLGYTQEYWQNNPGLWLSIIHEDDRERVLKETAKAIHEQSDTDFDYRLYARDGSVFWVHDKGHFVRDEKGELVTWEGFLIDISNRKRNADEREGAVAETVDQTESAAEKTILLVEDEEIIREMVRHILLASDYQVTTAESGQAALEICATTDKPFDLLITDFNMPKMNGRQLAEKVKALGMAKEVLFISGYTDDNEFLSDLSDTEKHFIAKPFSPEVLTTKVSELID